jgi:hypothetical protein
LVDRRPHRLALLRGIHFGQPQRIGPIMADQLPAKPAGFLDDLRVMVADLAVQAPMPCQNLHQAPDADAVAIVAHCPVAHIRDLSVLARHSLVEVVRHHVVETEEFNIGLTQSATRAPPGQVSLGRRVMGT